MKNYYIFFFLLSLSNRYMVFAGHNDFIVWLGSGDHWKNSVEFFYIRALKISPPYIYNIFQCIGKMGLLHHMTSSVCLYNLNITRLLHWHTSLVYILQGYFTDTGQCLITHIYEALDWAIIWTIIWLPQCQWSNHEVMSVIKQCLTTTNTRSH